MIFYLNTHKKRMKYISHRGNIRGINTSLENTPDYIDYALSKGFDVEVDVRVISDKIFLGHDIPDHEISIDFLLYREKSLWCHCKNLEAMTLLSSNGLHCFSHDKDDYVFTSRGVGWAYPNKPVDKNTVSVVFGNKPLNFLDNCYGICSDWVEFYRD